VFLYDSYDTPDPTGVLELASMYGVRLFGVVGCALHRGGDEARFYKAALDAEHKTLDVNEVLVQSSAWKILPVSRLGTVSSMSQ
jgi:hypothetical protein